MNYLIQHPMQFISSLNNTVPIIAIHHEYETLSVLEVVPPQWADLQKEVTRLSFCHMLERLVK